MPESNRLKNPAAVALGRLGGLASAKVATEAKRAASRENGKLGGAGRHRKERAMTKSRAIREAREQSGMFRQGSGYVVWTYDERAKCRSEHVERPYFSARQHLAEWRRATALELMGMPADEAQMYVDTAADFERGIAEVAAGQEATP